MSHNSYFCYVLTILAFLIVLSPNANGGEVYLKNGDRLTGEIIRMENDILVLKTTYAGEIKINQAELECFFSEEALNFMFRDKRHQTGRAACSAAGLSKFGEKQKTELSPVAISELIAVNPTRPAPKIKYQGNITGGGSFAHGNTDTRSSYASGKLILRSDRHRLSSSAKYNYGESEDKETADNAAGTLKYDYFITQKLFAYVQTLLEHDALQNLDLRSTFGTGLGYQFVENDRTNLYVEAGASYVNENFKNSDDDSYNSGRWSASFNYEIIPERLKFFHLHEGYVSLEDTEAIFFRSEQGLRLPLVKDFFANIQIDFDFNNKPAAGKERTDTRYIFGVGYDFGH